MTEKEEDLFDVNHEEEEEETEENLGIYSEEQLEKELEEDGISPEEEGFMMGYLETRKDKKSLL